MQMFGLVSLIITIALVAVWFTSTSGGSHEVKNEDGTVTTETNYQGAVNQAKDVADLMEKRQEQE